MWGKTGNCLCPTLRPGSVCQDSKTVDMIAGMSLLLRIPLLLPCLRRLFLGGDLHNEAPLLLPALLMAGVLDETGQPPPRWEPRGLRVFVAEFVATSSAG